METTEEKKNPAEQPEVAVSPLSSSDTAFIREKIKERPINKRKLFRRTLLTALLALVFGGIACLTFLLLEPVFSARLAPAEEPEIVTFPTSDDEIQPEDLYADDREIASAQEQLVAESIQASIEASEQDRVETAVNQALASYMMNESDARELYHAVHMVSDEVEPSLVLIRAAATDNDFVGGIIERTDETPGLIIADNGIELLILARSDILSRGPDMTVTWSTGERNDASLKMRDDEIGLCVLAVPKRALSQTTRETVSPASLGSSSGNTFPGTPVIAVGSPTGVYRSVCYGMINSERIPIDRTDKALTVYTTDIFGGGASDGFLMNYNAQVVGVIYPEPLDGVDENRVIAYSISELKKSIEHMVNAIPEPRLGIHGVDVTTAVSDSLGIPQGAFISRIETSSPAMDAGLQSGDVIIQAGSETVVSWTQFVSLLEEQEAGQEWAISVLRLGPSEERIPMQLTLTLGGEES